MSNKSQDSMVSISKGGTVLTGDAIIWAQMLSIASALGLAEKGIMVRRGVTRRHLLTLATRHTGKAYNNSTKSCAAARADLMAKADALRAIIPTEVI